MVDLNGRINDFVDFPAMVDWGFESLLFVPTIHLFTNHANFRLGMGKGLCIQHYTTVFGCLFIMASGQIAAIYLSVPKGIQGWCLSLVEIISIYSNLKCDLNLNWFHLNFDPSNPSNLRFKFPNLPPSFRHSWQQDLLVIRADRDNYYYGHLVNPMTSLGKFHHNNSACSTEPWKSWVYD